VTSRSGLLLLDKAADWTSHDVVAKVRGIAKTRRVGHAGTLDPMATGLLLLGINNATKLLTFLVGEDKTYITTIRLGASTLTDDRESEYLTIAEPGAVEQLSAESIRAVIATLTGQIMQVPSSVSAIKVNGERAYAKVRGGDEVKLAARPITVSRFEILGELRLVEEAGHKFVDLDAIIDCSSGTYIRALARDLGASLSVGGHLTALRRTRIGGYNLTDAVGIDALNPDGLNILRSRDAARAQFDSRELTAQEVIDLRHGKRIAVGHVEPSLTARDRTIAAFAPDGTLTAMLTKSGGQLKSAVVFQEETDD
jgi:tRNA pseudouridine55 synthase